MRHSSGDLRNPRMGPPITQVITSICIPGAIIAQLRNRLATRVVHRLGRGNVRHWRDWMFRYLPCGYRYTNFIRHNCLLSRRMQGVGISIGPKNFEVLGLVTVQHKGTKPKWSGNKYAERKVRDIKKIFIDGCRGLVGGGCYGEIGGARGRLRSAAHVVRGTGII